MPRAIVAVLVAMLVMGAAAAQTPVRYDRALTMNALIHDGEERSVGVYVPSSYRASAPAPLIIALHGRFSSAQAFHAQSRLASVAEARGAIVIYPETLGGFWNDGGHALLNRYGAPADDAGFIAAATAAINADHPIDPAQIYLVGYDSGGAMAYSLACRSETRFAGAAVVSARTFGLNRPLITRFSGAPRNNSQSQSLIDAACTRTRTSSSVGTGFLTSLICRTSGDPYAQ